MCIGSLRAVLAVMLVTVAACSADEKPEAPAYLQQVDASKTGAVTGRVSFEGAPPVNPPVRMSADPKCIEANAAGMTSEAYVVEDGGLENVFVYVKDGLGQYRFDVPAEPVKLNQQGCRYAPHVFGLRVGQPLEITNSDETTHNVHSLPDVNREFNLAQFVKGQQNVQTFTAAEVMIPLKCDLHPWMYAYVGVVEHPYFAVTREGGKFELKGLPAGTYTIEAWHQKAGTQTQQVTVGDKESKSIGFTFTAAATAN